MFAGFNNFLSQKMAVAWNVPPNEEDEGWGRNVPHWQLKGVCGGVAGGVLQQQSSTSWTPSLSLPPSGEDFVPLWQIWKDSLWTEATGAKNTLALVAQLCLVLLFAVQAVLIFYICYEEYGKCFSFFLLTVCIKAYIQNRKPLCIIRTATHGYFWRWKFAKGDSNCCIFIPYVAIFCLTQPCNH